MLAFTDLGRHYTQAQLARVREQKHPAISAWAGERIFVSFVVGPVAKEQVPTISIDLPDNWQVEIGVVRETSAYIGRGMTWGEIPTGPNAPAADYVQPLASLTAAPASYLHCVAAIAVPDENIDPGPVTTTIRAGQKTLPLTINIAVLDYLYISPQLFSLELWQYPYAVARYYGVTPFSPEHEALVRENLHRYVQWGGDTIATTIVEDPWHHQTYDAYPSLVQWQQTADGGFTFDFSHFDQYVDWNIDEGINRKIKCFSLLPWDNIIRYKDAQGNWQEERPAVGSARWREIWTAFLTAFIPHLTDAGWFTHTYMALDERPIDEMRTIIDFLAGFQNEYGESLKLSGAVNYQTAAADVLARYDDLSINQAELGDPQKFQAFAAARRAQGQETTFYNCVGNYPSMFALSNPIETAYLIWYFAALGVDGFLRWALDAWLAEPYTTISHWYWESGDPFLIYPHHPGETGAYRTPRGMMLEHAMSQARQWRFLASDEDTRDLPEVHTLTDYIQMLADLPLPAKTTNDYGATVAVHPAADRKEMQAVVAKIEKLLAAATQAVTAMMW